MASVDTLFMQCTYFHMRHIYWLWYKGSHAVYTLSPVPHSALLQHERAHVRLRSFTFYVTKITRTLVSQFYAVYLETECLKRTAVCTC